MNRHRLLLLAAGLAAASVALCAATPQSFLDGNPQTKTDTHLYKVQIVAVDGDVQHTTPVALTPGPHWIEVISPMPPRIPKSQTFVLKIQPCTYYYLGAHKDSPAADNWKLVIDAEETIQSCDPADEMRKAQTTVPTTPPRTH